MAEPLAAPQPLPIGGRTRSTWTPAQAQAMAARSAQVRAERAAAKALAASQAQAAQAITQPLTAAQIATERQLVLVSEQIDNTRAVLNDSKPCHCPKCGHRTREAWSMEPHHRAALLRALDHLLDRQRVLLAIPLPGSLKPTGKPSRPSRAGMGDARAEAEPGQAAGAALG